MFCDIRSFTSIAEAQDPSETIELLNDYYTLMMDAIGGEGGIVSLMIGDGLMAIFGAPVAARGSPAAGRSRRLRDGRVDPPFQRGAASRGKVEIGIGIGIASGQVVAGYTGTQHRATYTCVGDTVNVAARLEAQTKELGHPILIAENTRAGLGKGIAVEPQGHVVLKGKRQPVKVYAVSVDALIAGGA